MTTKAMTWSDFVDFAGDYEVVKQSSWRWGTRDTMVIHDEDGKHWMITIEVHSQEGWQDCGDVELVEVHKVPVTVEEWVPL